ncbi:hypothetical protein SKAU_G00267380 [Synaphobranchus kaupii]|uniref:Uncharacterized protein n=1 Tax=Synaphobranchus kaupii TaxID=118154 RepID=A0A9Q1IQ97_SYNKA|nr:hypothetical protein SKAU_G00267380 [Synaphobranchus kaupii]
MLFLVLLLIALQTAEQAGEVMAVATTPDPMALSSSAEEQRQAPPQLVQEQGDVAGSQAEVAQLLKAMRQQGAEQLTHLHSLNRHQSLLVENNQALLLQVSRIAGLLQDLSKKLQTPEANGKQDSASE